MTVAPIHTQVLFDEHRRGQAAFFKLAFSSHPE
jgi:hypothetical protein